MLRLWLAFLMSVVFAACTQESYDTGDGTYSYLRADFAEAYTNSQKQFTSAITDDGDSLVFASPVTTTWAAQTDTVYRCLVYYDYGSRPVKVQAVARVLTPNVHRAEDLDTVPNTDPLNINSVWRSANGKYLNLGVTVLTGQADEETGAQTIGVVCDSVTINDDGHRSTHLRLTHDQNGVPQYYSASAYVSIPTARLPFVPADGDQVLITVNTYDGVIVRSFY